jgi:hypothetical protein
MNIYLFGNELNFDMMGGRIGGEIFLLLLPLILIGIFNQMGYSQNVSDSEQDNVETEFINITKGKNIDLRSFPNNSQLINNMPRLQVTEIEKEQSYNEFIDEAKNRSNSMINDFISSNLSSSQSPRIRTSWNGLDIFSAAELKQINSSFGYLHPVNPPDVTIGVGKNNVVQIVHSSIGIWNKTGVPLKTVSLYDFFNVTRNHFITDPKILYDNTSGHWFATIIDGGVENETGKDRFTCQPGCKVKIAISNTEDPTQTWRIKEIVTKNASYFPDQPKITANKLNFTISTTEFLPTINNSNYPTTVILDKNVLINHNTQNGKMSNHTYDYPQNPIQYITPLTCFSTAAVIKDNKSNLFSDVTNVKIYDFCDPSNVRHHYKQPVKLTSKLSAAPEFKQPLLESNTMSTDARNHKMEIVILSGIRNENTIWLALHSACTPIAISDHSCVNILRFDKIPAPGTIFGYKYNQTENTQFDVSGTDVYYPVIGMSKNGKLFFLSGLSNSSTYPSLMVSRLISENQTNDRYLVMGSDINNSTSYGDYFGSAIDPVDGSVWLSGEYVDRSIPIPRNFPAEQLNSWRDKAWSTIIAKVS